MNKNMLPCNPQTYWSIKGFKFSDSLFSRPCLEDFVGEVSDLTTRFLESSVFDLDDLSSGEDCLPRDGEPKMLGGRLRFPDRLMVGDANTCCPDVPIFRAYTSSGTTIDLPGQEPWVAGGALQ